MSKKPGTRTYITKSKAGQYAVSVWIDGVRRFRLDKISSSQRARHVALVYIETRDPEQAIAARGS